MRAVYTGNNYIELQIVKGLLKQNGIDAESDGEALQGGIGELPVHDLLKIRVPEQQFAEASELIAAFERGDFALEDEL